MQFDVHRNRGRGVEIAPFLIALQHDRTEVLGTVVVAPLLSFDRRDVLGRLTPVVTVEGANYLVSTAEILPLNAVASGRSSATSFPNETVSCQPWTSSSPAYEALPDMAEIVNLRTARKKKAREDKQREAAENRDRFGRTREQVERERRILEMSARGLDAHRRGRPEDED